MTDQMQAIQDDIRYMRALADEGRRAPLLGGPILLMAGLTFGAASLSAWAFQNRLLSLDPAWQNAVWAASFIAFLTTLKLLMRGQSKKVGASAVNNRTSGLVWSLGGWSIFAFLLAMAAACWRLQSAAPTVMIAPFVLVIYGIGWAVASMMSDLKWLRWLGVGAFAGAVVMGLLAGSSVQYLAYAAALLLLAALPGWLLLRQEPSTTV